MHFNQLLFIGIRIEINNHAVHLDLVYLDNLLNSVFSHLTSISTSFSRILAAYILKNSTISWEKNVKTTNSAFQRRLSRVSTEDRGLRGDH